MSILFGHWLTAPLFSTNQVTIYSKWHQINSAGYFFTYLWFPNLYLHIVQSINKIVTMGGMVFCDHYFFVNFVLFFCMSLYEPLNLLNQTRWTLLIVCIFFLYKKYYLGCKIEYWANYYKCAWFCCRFLVGSGYDLECDTV